jgi:hypothetical protein
VRWFIVSSFGEARKSGIEGRRRSLGAAARRRTGDLAGCAARDRAAIIAA